LACQLLVRLEDACGGNTHLLVNLELVDNGREVRKDLVGLLMEFHLRGNQLGEVAQRLRGVQHLLQSASDAKRKPGNARSS
jgi:hypothetical protein